MANSTDIQSAITWMNVNQAAAYLGLSPKTIYQYVCDRRIPFVKIPTSNQVRFNRKLIDAWMENGQTETITDLIHERGG
jgi:excisionase family DNA binding protein